MLNWCSSAEAFVPSMVYFAGMEGSDQKQYAWDWENCSSHSPSTTFPSTNNNLQNHAFFPSTSFLDCPPPLLPANSFPSFYAPPAVSEYPTGLLKREDDIGRIGLNLGRRTYFSCGDALAIDQLFARSRGLHSWSSHSPRCQAEGCKADLSGAKHYHRRHKVCEFHSKATVVILGQLQQRFCQQCSRFHVLAEFDEAKRSCRKRLADHNRRRRKPQLPPTTDSSASKSTDINSSSEKAKQAPETTRDHSIGTKSTGNIFCTTNANTKVSVEGQQYQKKGNLLRNGPALSLGGVDASEKSGTGTNTVMYQVQGPFVTVADEEHVSQQQQQQHCSSSSSASNSTLYFHHHLFCSSSHEPSQCSGGGSGRSTSDHHQSNNLHVPPRAGFV